ncbi:hypothetical protein JZ751_020386 [Albula glossodonta]|uniref:Rho-GAP domain-containing protein n=1 Tax=Albula glossodonta TaxID=121402 RepID=A0A8T2MSJ0_9TELE|nr:hypothetical protein JZ751_020386 [Albula glossodonta]
MEREDTQARCRELRLVSERLPRANVRLLQWLLGVLHRVSQSAHFNKMDARNLAVCVAPNLLPLNSLCLDKLEKMTVLTQFLIERCEDIFTDSLQTESKERTEDQLADSTDSLLSHGQDSAYDSTDPEADVEAGRDRPEAPPTGPSPGPASRRPSRPVSRRRSEPSMLRSAGMRTLLKLARGQEEDQQARPLRKQNSHDSFLLPHGGQTTPLLPLGPGSSSSPSPSPRPAPPPSPPPLPHP